MLSAEHRHELRIAVKKLRYLAEFYQPLFPRKHSKPYLAALKDLQDGLGHLNDIAVASRLIDRASAMSVAKTKARRERPMADSATEGPETVSPPTAADEIATPFDADIAIETAFSLRAAGGLVIGWHSRGLVDLEPELRTRWRAFRQIKPFWSA